jgi:hypothetical protein
MSLNLETRPWKGLAATIASIAMMSTATSAHATDEAQAEQPLAEPEPAAQERSWTDYIEPKADLRYRIELIDTADKDLRYRHRIRARAGLVGKIHETFEATIQLGTGGSDDPVSNNQSMTEAFSSKPVWLDLAYFHWHPTGWIDDVHLMGGKMKNPFTRVGKSELLWDPDLNPEGLALELGHRFGAFEPLLGGGAFFIEERKEDSDSWLYGAQLSGKLHFLDDRLYFLLGGGYFNFTDVEGHETFWDETDGFGNTAELSDPADEESPLLYVYDYDIAEGLLEIGGKICKVPWAAFGSLAYNFAIEDDNFGWLAGALVGQTKETFDLYGRYIYRQVQSDYTVALFSDSDFKGGGTDGTGHEWNLSFVVYKPIVLAVTYFYNHTPYDDGDAYHRAQIDLKLEF